MAVSDSSLTRSSELFERAARVLPGGVSSPVRVFAAVGGAPPFIARGEGAHLVDVDGNRYLDFVMSWGPLILGHAHPEIVDSVHAAAQRGTSYGAPHLLELELAEHVLRMCEGAERVRFVSSGTEATMSAIRLARGATGRDRLVKFSGCYHGHADSLLVAAGSGGVTFGTPSSAGVPAAAAELTTVLPLDDIDAFRALMEQQGDEVAAVIIEPVPANNGLLLQRREFLEELRAATLRHGALLIFDEVISGFRVAPGGAAELYDIRPDLCTYGKVIGGGLPVGAFAGSAEVFEHLAPLGPVYQAGTLSGNPVAMAAGLRTLQILEPGGHMECEVTGILQRAGYPVRMVRQGSLFWFSFDSGEPPRTAECIAPAAADLYRVFFHACLARGVYLAPSAYEVGFLSTAHTKANIYRAIGIFDDAFAETFKS